MAEIKNRRENILINAIPPEILTADQAADAALEAVADAGYLTAETAATEGFVKNTDYATSDTGGVVKVSVNFGSGMSQSGILYGAARSEVQYNAANNTLLISKGTLENVIQTLVKRELITLLGGLDTDADGTQLSSWFADKTADGWNIAAAKSTPGT